jgi:hypothetical protein
MLFSPVYIESHPRRYAAHAASCSSSISSNSFTSYFFRTLASRLKATVFSNPYAITRFRTLCKIPGIGYPPPSILFSTPQPRACARNARSLVLTPVFATHSKNHSLSLFTATHPKSLDLKSFVCHTSAKGGIPPPSVLPDCLFARAAATQREMATAGSSGRCRPKDAEVFFDAGEVSVAGGEGGFAIDGEGGGEAVDVWEIEIGFEFSSVARELDIGRDQMDRQLGNLRENMPGESRALVAPDRIVHLAPIDDAHEEFALPINGELNELLDRFGARTVSRKCHDGAGVEDDTLHSSGRFTAFALGGAPQGEFPEPWSACRGSRGDCE